MKYDSIRYFANDMYLFHVWMYCSEADFKFEQCCFGIMLVFPIVILWAIWKEIRKLFKILKEKQNGIFRCTDNCFYNFEIN